MHRQSGIALIAFVLALQLLSLEVSAQTCPITTKKANSLSFSGVKKSCGALDSAKHTSCDACLCSLTDTFVPALKAVGFDLEKAGGLVGAERILQSCMMVLAVPLATAGVPLSSLLGLTQCSYDAKTYPKCVSGLVENVPEPMVDEFKTTSTEDETKASEPESFIEEIAADCQCSSEFDPVCDYSGFWYTNYCVSKCKGAKLVENCSPVFKEIEEREEPFVLTEKDAPFMWKAGCQCSQGTDDFDPVCDIDGKQYSSPCYADCLGATDVFDCRSLVIDFELSGEGPIIEEPSVEAQDGRVPDTVKPDVPDVTDPRPPTPPKPSPEPSPDTDTHTELPPEVVALFTQLGVDVSAFPPELTLMAYKIIQGEQITDEELAVARELMQDKERMAEARLKINPSYLNQLSLFAAGSTGNNKLLLEELIAVLSEVPATPEKDKQALRNCFKGCKQGTPVCSTSSGEEFATACHARCAGVTDTQPCYHDNDNSGASILLLGQTSVLAALLGALAVANL